jgi:hypothetical protein
MRSLGSNQLLASQVDHSLVRRLLGDRAEHLDQPLLSGRALCRRHVRGQLLLKPFPPNEAGRNTVAVSIEGQA